VQPPAKKRFILLICARVKNVTVDYLKKALPAIWIANPMTIIMAPI
jgi:hypothetical protein